VELAKQRITEGRFDDAEKLAKTVLSDNYNPQDPAAVTLLSETPSSLARAVTYAVRRALHADPRGPSDGIPE